MLGWFILRKTVLGRSIYALGGNAASAQRAGFNILRLQLFVYGFMGLMAGIGSVIQALLVQTVAPNSLVGKELDVIAAVVLGGASLTGGVGTVLGHRAGRGADGDHEQRADPDARPSYWYKVVTGFIILVSVAAGAWRQKSHLKQKSHHGSGITREAMIMFRKNSELMVLILVLAGVLVMMLALNGPSFFKLGNIQSMAFQIPELGVLVAGDDDHHAHLGDQPVDHRLDQPVRDRHGADHDHAGAANGGSALGVVLLALLAGVLVAALIGLLNGWLIAYLDISPILATLGTMILVSGFAIVLTKGYVISGFPKEMLFIGNGVILGIPVPLLIFLGCAGVLALMLERMPLGTRIYLFGSNPIATFYSGVNNKAVLMRVYLISGLLTSVAAMIMIARFNSAKADYGESYLLLTILACVLGGVNAAGGFGRVSGLVVALIILQIISSGLNLLGVSAFLTVALWGIVLIFVMVIKYLLEQRTLRSASR